MKDLSLRFNKFKENLKTKLYKNSNLVKFFPLLILLLALPVVVIVALQRQSTRNFAGGGTESLLASVEIHPGSIDIREDYKSIGVSALAFDIAGSPMFSGITYEWSMSSTNSVATLTKTDGDITELIPLNPGYADLHVVARSGNKTVEKSVKVTVRFADGSLPPTPTNTSTPTPTATPIPTPTPTTISMIVSEDVYVRSDQKTTNYGKEKKLRTLSSPKQITYMKYDLSSLAGKTIQKAILRIKVSNVSDAPSNSTQLLNQVGTSAWRESQMTYNKRPIPFGLVKTFKANKRNTTFDIDITPWVKVNKGKIASLAIESNGKDNLILNSKESPTGKPTLIVTYYS